MTVPTDRQATSSDHGTTVLPERAPRAVASSSPLNGPLSNLLVLGGQQRNRAGLRELEQHWYGYGKGVGIAVDRGVPSEVFEHRSEPGTCGPEDPELFKSSTIIGDKLYACSQTEVMVYSLPTMERLHHLSLPYFNDVHHVVPGLPGQPDENHLYASVSGQDLVAQVSLDEADYGQTIALWGVDGSDPTSRIDPERDYRINTKLKPHAFHPNYLFRMPNGDLWVTRFETRDAVKVGDPAQRIDIGQERCHDGVVHAAVDNTPGPTGCTDRVYFTTIDGHVIEADCETHEVLAKHPLTGSRENTLLGWCRGLTFTDDYAIVGFSRIRHTKVRGALSWVRNGLSASEPTRIAVYDRRSWALVDEVDLEPAGCNAVFSVFVRESLS